MKKTSQATMGNQSMYNTLLGYARHGYEVHLLTCTRRLMTTPDLPENIIIHRHLVPGRKTWQACRLFLGKIRNLLREWKTSCAPVGSQDSESSEVKTDIGYKGYRRTSLTLAFYLVLGFWALLLSLRYRFRFFYGYEIYGTVIARFMGILFRKPVVSRFQGTLLSRYLDEPEKIRYNWSHWWPMQMKTDLVIMTNDGTQGDQMLDFLGVPKDRYVFWRNGVAFEKELDKTEDPILFRAEQGISPETVLFTSASRMVFWKRIDRMLRAIVLIPKDRDFLLVLMGTGQQYEPLCALANQLGIANRVRFTGPLPHREVIRWHNAADALISTFDVSNVGNQMLEAQRLGKPYVSVNTGDTAQILKHEVNGLLVEDPDDHTGIANAILRMIDDSELRKQLARGAKTVGKTEVLNWEQRSDMEIATVEERFHLTKAQMKKIKPPLQTCDKKLKVLFVTGGYPSVQKPIGGIMVRELASAIRSIGIDFRVVHLKSDVIWPFCLLNRYHSGQVQTDMEDPNWVLRCRVRSWPRAFGITFRGPRRAPRLEQAISKTWPDFRPDIIHARTFIQGGLTAQRLARKYQCPLVISTHGMDTRVFLQRWAPRRAILRLCRDIPVVICVSKSIRDALNKSGAPAKKIQVIHNGIDLGKIHTGPNPITEHYSGTRLVVGLGNLKNTKGFDYLIRAIHILHPKYPDLRCTIVGGGIEFKSLCRLRDQLRLAGVVDLVGEKSPQEAMVYLAACDIFCLPSWSEGFGIVYLEAMAHGKPVVAVRGQGFWQVIEQCGVGRICEPRNLESLIAVLGGMLETPEQAQAMGERGRELVLQEYTWAHCARKYLAVYNQVINGNV